MPNLSFQHGYDAVIKSVENALQKSERDLTELSNDPVRQQNGKDYEHHEVALSTNANDNVLCCRYSNNPGRTSGRK